MGVSAAPRRIGLFGGAFDPPHLAHAALVRAAMAQLHLDALHVLPTGQAWHKTRTLSAAHHRLAMARLAFADPPGVVVDDREIRRPGPTYTIDTLRELQAAEPGASLVLVIGTDQAAALPRWRDWQEIVKIAIISVADRDQMTGAKGQFDLENVPGVRLQPLNLPAMPISATAIRDQIAAGPDGLKRVAHLVAPGVARYIEHHHLYQTA
ncbi:MAG: nicotinate (nicotinamide) nucleotide adenylyltransferase [Burkholderiaceae bacterium]|nr:nicotinate (nicotinamide) nucleotide adenylyltransferase [Burkholderiaceae bacterium]MDZ4144986.1 nicotinate (nicotinamide) nucleotide adenylyltransferase [Burkholderiales bacterium]